MTDERIPLARPSPGEEELAEIRSGAGSSGRSRFLAPGAIIRTTGDLVYTDF